MSANGTYAISAITAITAQNTMSVSEVYELPDHIIASQLGRHFHRL